MLTSVATGLGWVFAILAGAGCLYTVMSAVFVVRFFQDGPALKLSPAADSYGGVSILKPLHGDEPGLRQNLSTFFAEAERVGAQIVLGVQNPADAAIAVVKALQAEYPGVKAVLCIDGTAHGANRKVSNLINMAAHVTGDVLVLSDSDIGASPCYLDGVIGALGQPGVGLVTLPYYGRGETGLWSHLAAQGLSYQFLPNVITGVSLGMATPCMGSTIALRLQTLNRIGGFEAFRDVLADDYAMGAAVRGLGIQSVVAPIAVSHSCAEATLGEVFAHELRWARTIKGVDFAGHAGSAVTHPLPLALIATLFLGLSTPSLILVAAAFIVRTTLMAAVDRVTRRPLGAWYALPIRDMLSLAVFVGSFFGHAVVWRGETLHVTADGDIRPV